MPYEPDEADIAMLSDDMKSVLWAQVGADIEELNHTVGNNYADIRALFDRVAYLEQVCAQCIAEHQGRGQ